MEYEEYIKKLNLDLSSQQEAAVKAVDGPVLLLAVPGGGKTTVLVARLGYMIFCRNIMPEDILTVTYTVAATRDMKARAASMFGEDIAERMEFRTINGICQKIIGTYTRMTGGQAFELITDEGMRARLISDIYRDVEQDYATDADIRSLSGAITYIKNMMLPEKEICEMDRKLHMKVSEIYMRYVRVLKEKRMMDFDDQMTYAYAMLRKYADILKFFQKKYRYICVDEAQDTSKIQHEIIRLLAGDRDNLFMVGDEDQSIYGFRAAYPEALISFEKNHPKAQVLLMEKNYRSGAEIVMAADRFIQKNEMRHEKRMEPARDNENKVKVINVDSRRKQYDYLASVAEKDEMETAVLYRYNESVIPLVNLLDKRGIPYRLKESDAVFFSNRMVTDIENILRFALNPYDTALFMKIYYRINTYLKKEQAEEACLISRRKGIPVLEAALYLSGVASYTKDNLKELIDNLEMICHAGAEHAINLIDYSMGYGEYLERSGMKDDRMYIIKSIASEEKNIQDYLQRMEKLRSIISTRRYSDSRFILSTIHSSKGLEYDRVYMMDVKDHVFPQNIPGKKAAADERAEYEEERRIFYVGMTRAKDYLNIFKTGPSVFVEDIKGKNRAKQIKRVDMKKLIEEMQPGTAVRHGKLGEGTIISCDEKKMKIRFTDGSEKTFATDIAGNHVKVI